MSDCCYFEITCRREHATRFEEIGFNEFMNTEASYTMHEEESRHSGGEDMPMDIPWHGRSEAGDNYGPALHACDGKNFASVESGHHGGYVVEVKHGNLVKRDRLLILKYERILNRAKKAIAKGNQ